MSEEPICVNGGGSRDLFHGLFHVRYFLRSNLDPMSRVGTATARPAQVEVARALGSSEVTVRSQISSARLKLRRFFRRREEVIP
jgi:hypothetical protein